ncbi:MAG TPA: cysteine desulfurase family protein [Rubrivivax sp.]|nr:cysteine desulfurase family protein [Rubrivivax sp.]
MNAPTPTSALARIGAAQRAPLYLDHNATTAPCAQAVAEMLDVLQRVWANPSSVHADGQAARSVLADARLRVARLLGCSAAELVFTSGATEANHMAVLGALAAHADAAGSAAAGPLRRQWVLSAVEHPGLMALAAQLRRRGTPTELIPVDAQGRLDLQAAQALVGPQTALLSVMAANNETGVLMPLAELAALAAARGAWLHVDATQWAGKLPLDFVASGAHLMSVSAHKLGGPKGVGALLVRRGLALPPLLAGRQERQRRGGTENLPGIVGFAAACDATLPTLASEARRQQALRDRLEQGLQAALPQLQLQVLGQAAPRLPNTSCLRFGHLSAELVLSRLERAGILASSGAACSAGGTQPSHVLLAMGLTPDQAKGSVRFSLGSSTQACDIERVIRDTTAALAPLLATARAAAGTASRYKAAARPAHAAAAAQARSAAQPIESPT